MCILTDVYGDQVICNKEYKRLGDAKADLHAEFIQFTSDDNYIEYGRDCFLSDDNMRAWARLDGKYRVWIINKV